MRKEENTIARRIRGCTFSFSKGAEQVPVFQADRDKPSLPAFSQQCAHRAASMFPALLPFKALFHNMSVKRQLIVGLIGLMLQNVDIIISQINIYDA